MLGAREEDQAAVGRDLAVQGAGLRGAGEAVGVAGEDQDRHAVGDAGDRLEGGDLVEVGQEEWGDDGQARVGGQVERRGQSEARSGSRRRP